VILCGTCSETSVALSQLLSFGKFQDTERFLSPCPRHFSSRLTPSGETSKYTTAPSTQKTWKGSLPIDMLSAVSLLLLAQPSSEVPEELLNYPVYGDGLVTEEVREKYFVRSTIFPQHHTSV